MDNPAFVADDDVVVTAHADTVTALFKNRSGETREIRLPLYLAVKLWSWTIPQGPSVHPSALPQFGAALGTDRRRRQDRRGKGGGDDGD